MKNKIIKRISDNLSSFSSEEIALFLQAFLTDQELEALKNRYNLVEELLRGKSQREISEELGVSISQITRGSRELKYGTGKEIFYKCFKK